MSTIFTIEEVSKHNSKSDLWVIIHNKVYDLTSYLEDHPGGIPSIIEVAGQDATVGFDEVQHTDAAKITLERFLIGKLDHDEDTQSTRLVRQLPPEPAMPAKIFVDKTNIKLAVEVLVIGAIVITGFNVSKRAGQYAGNRPWAPSSTFGRILPYLTSSSLMSVLIQICVKREFPRSTRAKRPDHFKIDGSTIVSPPTIKEAALKADQFIDFSIRSIEKLSKDSNKIILDLPEPTSILGLPVGQHLTIRGTIKGQQVSRAYTPTSSNKDLGRLELVIKNYDDGHLTGQYLRHVEVGDTLSISGPKGRMHYRRGLAKTINMIAGGTGITPMYQLIRAICEDPLDTTKIVLIYANQTAADILLKTELDAFQDKYSDQLTTHYILSRPGSEWRGEVGRCTSTLCQKFFESGNDKQNKAMICGPPGMVENAKEWLVDMGYEHAKPVSRMRDQVFIF